MSERRWHVPRAQGFARGDLDAAFPLDDKFIALRGRVTAERYYEAAGIYFHVAAATWREAERKPVSKVCPDAGDVVTDLIAVGLFDEDGCVTRRAFANTVGRAKRQRRVTTDRQARNRSQKRDVTRDTPLHRDASDDDPVSNRTQMSRVTSRDSGVTSRESQPARDSALYGTDVAPLDRTARDDEPEWPVLSYLASVGATVAPNGNGYHRELVQLVGRQGAVKVLAAMKARRAAGDRSARQLIYGAANDLEPIARRGKPQTKGYTASEEEANRAFDN